jgi:ferrous iron transport protein B
VWQRVGVFLRRAGTVIFAIAVMLWALERYPAADRSASADVQLSHSALGQIGHAVEPAVQPLGLDWKVGVAMIASFAAREVFVSTMATMYGVTQDGNAKEALAVRLRESRTADGRVQYSRAAALGLLAFYVFALMCTSTIAVTIRETGGGWRGAGWAAFQFSYMLALAWVSAFAVYHGAIAMGLGGLA